MKCLNCLQKELAAHKAALKGDSFKLNMHPKAYFDANPYHTDKPMSRKGSGSITKKIDGAKFKPSSPGKRVCHIIMCIIIISKKYSQEQAAKR